MSNSSLVNVKVMTKHYGYPDGKAGRGGTKIDKIFVHHMAGILTAEQCGNVFKSRQASAHYGIDTKGRIGQYVDEANAAWHCGSKAYNLRSIGIELSNDGGAKTGWHVADKTIAKCIDLIVDICKRNDIKKINYTGDLKGNLCMHRWVASTACPASYLGGKFKYIAEQVNKKLGAAPAKETLYRVRKTWADAKSQKGAYKVLANAKKECDKYAGYSVFDESGKAVYTSKKKDELYRVRKTWADVKSQIGAYKTLANAKKACDQHAGYSVFNESGKAVYTSKTPSIVSKMFDACKVQAEYMKNYKYGWQPNPTIEKSKNKGTCVTYVACVLQRIGLIKSGEFIWHDGKGHVDNINPKRLVVSYPKGTIKNNKKNLRAGDIILAGDKKSVEAGGNSHIFIFTGEWSGNNPIVYDNGSADRVRKGLKPANTYSGNSNIIGIVRPTEE